MCNFITNSDTKNLGNRIVDLIPKCEELKILVGFFCFSGIKEFYEGLKKNPRIKIYVLVGLNIDDTMFFCQRIRGKDFP